MLLECVFYSRSTTNSAEEFFSNDDPSSVWMFLIPTCSQSYWRTDRNERTDRNAWFNHNGDHEEPMRLRIDRLWSDEIRWRSEHTMTRRHEERIGCMLMIMNEEAMRIATRIFRRMKKDWKKNRWLIRRRTDNWSSRWHKHFRHYKNVRCYKPAVAACFTTTAFKCFLFKSLTPSPCLRLQNSLLIPCLFNRSS